MSDPRALTNMVARAHEHLAPVLNPGELAVDLTAGNGRDTLFLYRCVGPTGRVLSFDIQKRALEATAARLREAGASVAVGPWKETASAAVHLIHDSHCRLDRYLAEAPRAMIANFGYLPGVRLVLRRIEQSY
jgi:16S rRNA C967 or C1407 C5-methylase (RsmB/RsmF family)